MTTPHNNSSNEKLMALYKELDDLPPKSQDSRLDAIRVLEPVIRKMIYNKYSLNDICKKINAGFDLKITTTTLTAYLDNIEIERKIALAATKLEATKAKREATRLAKSAAIAHQIPDNGKVLESTQLSEVVTSQALELIPEAIASSTINQKSSDIIKSVVPKSLKSSKVKPIAITTEVEILPVNIQTQAIDSDSDAETLAKKEAEANRLHELEMDKHFNKY